MSAANGSAASASDGRVAVVRSPRRRASSSPSLQSAVLPIPGPPATTSALAPSAPSRKARISASSPSRPNSSAIVASL